MLLVPPEQDGSVLARWDWLPSTGLMVLW